MIVLKRFVSFPMELGYFANHFHQLKYFCAFDGISNLRELGNQPLLFVPHQIVPLEPKESTAFFRYNVQRSHDPKTVYQKGLEYLQSTYFQKPDLFSDELTAVFQPGSELAARLLALKTCLIEFDELSQNFKMLAKVRKLGPREAAFHATLWHNRTFNPEIPNDLIILGLTPDWRSAQAHPETA